MNIFILSLNAKKAAEQHCDKHVVKMILETTQLLYMCWNYFDEDKWRQKLEEQLKENSIIKNMIENKQKVNLNTYKSGKGHMNHPCSKWVRESVENYKWLCKLGIELCDEKMYRWPKNKQHSCLGHLQILQKNIPVNLPNIEQTKFALAMPDENKTNNAVESYQKYYKNDKQKLVKWTNRETPKWI